jgi:endonuclease III
MLQLPLPLCGVSPLKDIRDRLLPVYGPQRDALRLIPLAQLVNGMVSSCTSDTVSGPAFVRLARSIRLETLPDAAPATIEVTISDVEHATRKSIQIVLATRFIRSRRGNLDLEFLDDWPLASSFTFLHRLPGVGAKIAAVVLNFSTLRKPVFVVDRHVLRVCKRLGLLPEKADYERGFHLLARQVPTDWSGDDLYELHWLVKMLGQAVCTHNRMACAICPLATICKTSSK